MHVNRYLIFFLFFILLISCEGKVEKCDLQGVLEYRKIVKTESNDEQQISIISIPKTALKDYYWSIGHDLLNSKTTSEFGKEAGAVVAMNGSYFDVDNGGSVTYFEEEDRRIFGSRKKGQPWYINEAILNGAIVIKKDGNISIKKNRKEKFFIKSKNEQFVLVAGPILVENGKRKKLPQTSFVSDRHPRTCLCITKDEVKLVVVDGRRSDADGMPLSTLQELVKKMKCRDAINFDGGGSSTLWSKSCGILNNPSDWNGERKIANALLLIPKK